MGDANLAQAGGCDDYQSSAWVKLLDGSRVSCCRVRPACGARTITPVLYKACAAGAFELLRAASDTLLEVQNVLLEACRVGGGPTGDGMRLIVCCLEGPKLRRRPCRRVQGLHLTADRYAPPSSSDSRVVWHIKQR